MARWDIEILANDGTERRFELHHDYNTADDAAREAENVADREFTEDDESWSVIPHYDLCPNCQEPLDDVDATVTSSLVGSVVNGKLTAEVINEDMVKCGCGKCGHVLLTKVKEWDYEPEGKEKGLGL